uniref:Uncharacterized protein n=1 Tax=Avena sativa TaxID=4498 RepID=A0ACD6A9T7_AVESA
MPHKRPLDAVDPPEQEVARFPRKRLRRTGLVMMWLERRRARAVTVEQMVRQAQLDTAKLIILLMVLVARLGSVEGLLLQLPNLLQRLWAEQFVTFQSSVMGSIQDTIRSVLRAEIQERQPVLLPNVVYERSRQMPECLPETGRSSGVLKLRFVDADRPKDPIYTGSPVQWQNGQNTKLTGMKRDNWSTMIEHASTCDPGNEIYSYRVAEENCELLFNDFYDLVGMIINGQYVPVRNLDQFQQRKVNNWKKSAYKKFEDRENSGGLIPDYLMSNGHPARAASLNNEAGPSVQARPTWQYPNSMAAQQGEF